MNTGSRSTSIQGRRSGEIIGGIEEEEEGEEPKEDGILGNHAIVDEEEEDDGDDEKWVDADQFGPELSSPTPGAVTDDPVSPPVPVPDLVIPSGFSVVEEDEETTKANDVANLAPRNVSTASIPLTEAALAKKDKQDLDDRAMSEGHEIAASADKG